jgi:hypothetical protein
MQAPFNPIWGSRSSEQAGRDLRKPGRTIRYLDAPLRERGIELSILSRREIGFSFSQPEIADIFLRSLALPHTERDNRRRTQGNSYMEGTTSIDQSAIQDADSGRN